MPYEWISPGAGDRPAELHLWPHRSLPRRGFVAFLGATAGLVAIPLLAVLGTAALWALLPFLGAAVWGIWSALSRSYRDGEVLETLRLEPGRLVLEQRRHGHVPLRFEANPYWLRVTLHPVPVEDYLVLEGGPRPVELGRFLTPPERRRLAPELRAALAAARRPDPLP